MISVILLFAIILGSIAEQKHPFRFLIAKLQWLLAVEKTFLAALHEARRVALIQWPIMLSNVRVETEPYAQTARRA